jgi:transposase-like protein
MIALLKQLPSEAKITKKIRKIIYGSNLCCPRCRSRRVYASEHRYRCRKCRRPFTIFTGTWLEGSKLALRTNYALLWCYTQRIPVLQTQKLCHVSEPTVRDWFRCYRVHIPDFTEVLAGTVQMDEAYFKRLALLMAKQVGSNRVAFRVVPKATVNKHDAAHFIFQNVEPRSRLQTDGSSIYKRIEKHWPVSHRKDIHAKWQFGLTSEIEGLFGNLRTFIRRMYHHVTPQYLPEYVTEFSIRFCSPEIFDSPLTFLEKTIKPVPTC